MKKIGLLSDTHSYLNPAIFDFFKEVDEIWHAGDIGKSEIIHQLRKFKPLRAVYGNIDDQEIRLECPKVQNFTIENMKVIMTHIGGYPGRYHPEARKLIQKEKPALFIAGHSHILKVMYDQKNELLHLNPGAAGKSGFHKVVTLLRFTIENTEIKDMEIFEQAR